MQHSDNSARTHNSYTTCDDLAEVLDRTIHRYDRLIQEQRLLLERLRTVHSSQTASAADFVIRKAA